MAFDEEPVCRLCDKHTTDLVSIFTKNADGQQIIQLVKKCFPIIIYRSDPLSKLICADCAENIQNLYNFKQIVDDVTIQQKFRLGQLKTSRSAILYLNSLQENEEDGNSLAEVPRSDQSTSTEDFCPTKSVDVDSLLDVDCNSYTDNEVTTNGNNDNEQEESDMEVEEDTKNSIIESKKRLAVRLDVDCPPPKRRRVIIGPQSIKDCAAAENLLSDSPAVKYSRRVYYEPHSLMQSCLNVFNSINVPDYYYETCRKIVETVEEIQNYCEECQTEFETETEFVEHENCRQLQLTLHRVDNLVYWPATNRDNYVRNLWLQSENPDTDIGEPEDDLLIPLADSATTNNNSSVAVTNVTNNDVTYVGEKVYINGVPLGQIGKKDRLYLYQTIRIQNIQRKFCTECRFTFKDNWAMDKHYTTLACLYTCRYCGRRFNSMRQVFENHVQMHVESGHGKSQKIFATNRRNDPNPRVINPATVRFLSPQQVVSKRGNRFHKSLNHLHKVFEQRSGVRPVNLQSLLQDPSIFEENVKVKGNAPNSQAYFCKKCYKVFFKLDEYNAHTATVCLGGGGDGGDPPIVTVAGSGLVTGRRSYTKQQQLAAKVITPAEVKRKLLLAVEEGIGGADSLDATASEDTKDGVLSPTGRPVRHCAREVRTYNDDVERIETPPPQAQSSAGRFNCGICASVFPNIHSRNSHMRIHKTGHQVKQTAQTMYAVTGPGAALLRGGPPPLRAGPIALQQMQQRQKEMMVQQYGGSNGGGLAQKIVNSLRQQKQVQQQQQQLQLQQRAARQQQTSYQRNISNHQSRQQQQQHQRAQAAAFNIGSAQRPVLHRPKLIKEEPIEPLVEIHEDEDSEEDVMEVQQQRDYPRSVGSVSITPIGGSTRQRQRDNQRAPSSRNSDPDILRLVQNNPHLSIKPKASSTNQSSQSRPSGSGMQQQSQQQQHAMLNNGGTPSQQQRRQYGTGPHALRTAQRHAMQAQAQQAAQAQAQQQAQLQQLILQSQQQQQMISGDSPPDADKMYRCSSCNVPFQNKSHLYFHKKNQCGGSKYPCPFCKKRFGTEAAYSSHIFYSHPI